MSEHPTAELRDGLRRLPKRLEPPAALEERTVTALRERGLLSPPAGGHSLGHRPSPRWWAIAACLAGALAGWLVRGSLVGVGPAAADSGQRFLLLLSEPVPLATDKSHSDLIAEYRGWAGRLADQGRLVAAERLVESGRSLGLAAAHPPGGLDAVTGLFLISADGWEEALALASTCPHLSYGGGITVRRAAAASDETR